MSLIEADLRINGNVVKWARERIDASLQETAALSGFSAEQIENWEVGTAEPTYNQAVTLAHKLSIPFGYLFLSKTPIRTLPLPDLRTVDGEIPRKPSVGLIAVVEDAIRKQHWYADLMDEKILPFVGAFSIKDSPTKIAANIRLTLGIDEQMRLESATVAAFLTELVRASERKGITVNHSTHEALEKLYDAKHVWRYIIPAAARVKLRSELRHLGYSSLTLFPDLDRVTELIESEYLK